jgi:hypothetical protein
MVNVSVEDKMDIQGYCVKIVGNLLAEKEDYCGVFMTAKILDRVGAVLKQC